MWVKEYRSYKNCKSSSSLFRTATIWAKENLRLRIKINKQNQINKVLLRIEEVLEIDFI